MADRDRASNKDRSEVAEACQAYLIVDARAEASDASGLAAAVERSGVASVLLQPSGAPVERLSALVGALQKTGVAVLIEADAKLALTLGADGVHLPPAATIEDAERRLGEARTVLGAGRIVGVATGLVRHDGMVLAEAGADYVAFEPMVGDNLPAVLDHIAWWADLVEVPCVAWGATSGEVALQMARSGADFVAAGPGETLANALRILAALKQGEEFSA